VFGRTDKRRAKNLRVQVEGRREELDEQPFVALEEGEEPPA